MILHLLRYLKRFLGFPLYPIYRVQGLQEVLMQSKCLLIPNYEHHGHLMPTGWVPNDFHKLSYENLFQERPRTLKLLHLQKTVIQTLVINKGD